MSAQIIPLKDGQICGNPAEFRPQRLFAFELRCRGHAARAGSAGIIDDPLKPGDAVLENG
jgi:hypothetical protein